MASDIAGTPCYENRHVLSLSLVIEGQTTIAIAIEKNRIPLDRQRPLRQYYSPQFKKQSPVLTTPQEKTSRQIWDFTGRAA